MGASIFIDGINLYYGTLKRTNFKRLNPVELGHELLRPERVADRPPYFAAWVSRIPDNNL